MKRVFALLLAAALLLSLAACDKKAPPETEAPTAESRTVPVMTEPTLPAPPVTEAMPSPTGANELPDVDPKPAETITPDTLEVKPPAAEEHTEERRVEYVDPENGETVATEILPPEEHQWQYEHDDTGHWLVCALCGQKNAVEAHTLDKTGKCAVCGYGCTHSFTAAAVAPTCTGSGCTVRTCSLCGYTCRSDLIPATGHSYEPKVEKPATCTQSGVRRYTCTRCGASFTRDIPATGHGAWHYESDKNGHWQTCSACGEVEPVEPHTLDKNGRCAVCGYGCRHSVADKTVAPTCTEAGYTEHSCSLCGYTWRDKPVSALDHSYQARVETPASCTASGVLRYACERCGASFTRSIPAAGHTVVTDPRVEATCSASGRTAGTHCSACGTVLTPQQTIPKKAHSYRDGICIRCGAADPSYVPPDTAPTEPPATTEPPAPTAPPQTEPPTPTSPPETDPPAPTAPPQTEPPDPTETMVPPWGSGGYELPQIPDN